MPVLLNEELIIRLDNERFTVSTIEDAYEISRKVLQSEKRLLAVCKVTGSFNIIDNCRLQTVNILSEEEVSPIGGFHFIKASADLVVAQVIESSGTSMTVQRLLTRANEISLIRGMLF